MDRRSFLIGTITTAVLAPTVLTGCPPKDDSDTDGGTGGGTDMGTEMGTEMGTDGDSDSSTVRCASGANGPDDRHGHDLTLTQAEVDSTSDITVSSTAGGHAHSFTITAAQLATLRDTGTLTFSSNDSHAHDWTITCS